MRVLHTDELLLARNNFTGPLPDGLYSLENLYKLDLSLNLFDSSISPNIGFMTNLSELLVQGNSLSGPLPPELGDLGNISVIKMQNNELSGEIPADMGALETLGKLHSSWMRNQSQCGFRRRHPLNLVAIRLYNRGTLRRRQPLLWNPAKRAVRPGKSHGLGYISQPI